MNQMSMNNETEKEHKEHCDALQSTNSEDPNEKLILKIQGCKLKDFHSPARPIC